MGWITKNNELLTLMWNKGLTAQSISIQLGISKESVLNQIDILGLIKKNTHHKKNGISILNLGFGMCKWPFGDPKNEDFYFCGNKIIDNKPYCAQHCKIAYLNSKTSPHTHTKKTAQKFGQFRKLK